ncbi:MAG: phytanoyl-CoA dioxygenase family protein [Bacteroidota bacterium]
MDFERVAQEFWENGYVIFEKFFSDELMDEYNRKILNHFESDPESELNNEFEQKSRVQVVPWFPYRENKPYFDEVDKNETFNKITDAILNDSWENLYCMMMYSKAGTIGQAWHQDCPPSDNTKFNINRLVYTHDITDATGGSIVVFPKTHTKGELTIGDPHEEMVGQEIYQPKKGTVIFLHGHCWHRVTPAKQDRISSNFRAIPKGISEDITDICVYRNMRYRFSTQEVIEDRKL